MRIPESRPAGPDRIGGQVAKSTNPGRYTAVKPLINVCGRHIGGGSRALCDDLRIYFLRGLGFYEHSASPNFARRKGALSWVEVREPAIWALFVAFASALWRP
jgi:hypothetical protein